MYMYIHKAHELYLIMHRIHGQTFVVCSRVTKRQAENTLASYITDAMTWQGHNPNMLSVERVNTVNMYYIIKA